MTLPATLLVLAWIGLVAGPIVCIWVVRRLLSSRRIFLGLSVTAVTAFVWMSGVWGFVIEPATLTVRHVVVESPQWCGTPLRIGVISDTHVGAPHVDVARIERLVERMNAERPDVVVLIGDYAGRREPAAVRARPETSEVLRGVEAFRGLRSPLGTHGVMGNHDSGFDESAVAAAMRRGGATPLSNQAIRIGRRGGDFWIAGVADVISPSGRASVPLTMRGVTDDAPVIVLSHWPDPFEDVPDRVSLTLAGHTHCGQVDLPFVGRPILPSPASYRWPCGLYDEGGRKLYVTGGVGVSILPVRFRAPPEIVLITLKAPQ